MLTVTVIIVKIITAVLVITATVAVTAAEVTVIEKVTHKLFLYQVRFQGRTKKKPKRVFLTCYFIMGIYNDAGFDLYHLLEDENL